MCAVSRGAEWQVEQVYSPRARADWLIASGRLALALFSFGAVWLDPAESSQYSPLAPWLTGAYIVYSLVRLGAVWTGSAPLKHPVIAHLLDLAVLCGFLFVSAGAPSPLFPFITFALVAASVRWQQRGTRWTAAATILMLGGIGLHAAIVHPEVFALNSFIIPLVSLGIAAVLLGELSAYWVRLRLETNKLSTAPEVGEGGLDEAVLALARWAADVMDARRVLIAWEELDEPWLYLAWWEGEEPRYAEEAPGVMEPLVAQDLAAVDFLCHRPGEPAAAVLYMSPEGLGQWRGDPLHPVLRRRFSVASVLSVRFEVDSLRGRLFVFDKPGMTSDDLVLGAIVARRIAGHLGRSYLVHRLVERVAREERVRSARDLHDGPLHALAGVALEMEAFLRTPKLDLARVRERFREIQDSLASEQRSLRILIRSLKAPTQDALDPPLGLSDRLGGLVRRLERQWGLRVEWSATNTEAVPDRLANEVYLLVHEALVNAARHAGASWVSLEVAHTNGRVTIAVADDGHGHSFKGRYDGATLATLGLGPATLRERTTHLGGSLTMDSTDAGTRLEISLPALPPAR
jgi:signal transduction histidine kinase